MVDSSTTLLGDEPRSGDDSFTSSTSSLLPDDTADSSSPSPAPSSLPPHPPPSPSASPLVQASIISVYVLCWVAQSEAAQALTTGGLGKVYEKPGFICYVNHSVLVLFHPFIYLLCLARRTTVASHMTRWRGSFTCRQVLLQYALLTANYFVCIWAWVLGMVYIAVSTSNALYQLQCVFTVIFSVLFLTEKFTPKKAAGTLLSLTGITVVVLPPLLTKNREGAPEKDNMLLGSALTVLSAVMWGAHEVRSPRASGRERSVGERGVVPPPPPPPRSVGV